MKNSQASRRKFLIGLGVAAAALPVAQSLNLAKSAATTVNQSKPVASTGSRGSVASVEPHWKLLAKDWRKLSQTKLKGVLSPGFMNMIQRRLDA
jgi:hypothetical protein